MISVPAGTQIWIAAGVTDLRRRFTGLSAIVQTTLGAHANSTYFCKVPEAPPEAMLVEVPRWMFDAAQCAAMQVAEIPHVDCATLHGLKRTVVELRTSLENSLA